MKIHRSKHWLSVLVVMLTVPGLMVSGGIMSVYAAGTGGLAPLNTVPVPLPANLGDFVKDQAAAIQLGKALFWDAQAGSDGKQACASCHYHAGADIRVKNTINPGVGGIFKTAKPGATLKAASFPIITNDIVGSGGVDTENFQGLSGTSADNGDVVTNPLFNVGGVNVRQVTGRNAPSVINAVYHYRQFWDGRANNTFNGVNPSGPNDQTANVYQVVNGQLLWLHVALPNASLASQSTGPILSPVEMSYAGRTFPLVGRKLLGLAPLAQQLVDTTDSVLGGLSLAPNNGLNTTYAAMIQAAFQPVWWDDSGIVPQPLVNGFNIMETNFSLFWGLSIMLYEATLISDQTPLDQFLAGNNAALTARQQLGMNVYIGKGRCNKCHSGAELSEATVSQAGQKPLAGFVNTGVRPIFQDKGDVLQPGRAAFKTTTLRNVELNGPYFHNGDKATLRQVVDFYDSGGDFPNRFTDGDVRPLNLSEAEKVALVDFMVAMTDERVRFERAPFDHPSLDVPDGPSLPAVGQGGSATPLARFMRLNPFAQ
jgi:cytochrome c peroxidase